MRLQWFSIGALLTVSTVLFAQPMAQGPPQGANQGPNDEAPADEPGRAVARLGILNGEASVRRGDSGDWVAAAVNAPLMSGDDLSVAAGGRAEVQLDPSHFVSIAGDSEVRLQDLENGHFQVQLPHGLITWRVVRNGQSQAEISTPLVAIHPGALSVVRVEVSADGTTRVTVRRGEVQVSTQTGSERVTENSTMIVRGTINDPEFQVVAASPRDEWDGWSDQRDAYLTRAQSPRYVPQEVSGAEDLDAYGNWGYDPAYGNVWTPTVASSWAPYRDGRWVWEDYYGWTWVDSSPWGWAPFHYGYWYNRVGFGWSWYPGARGGRTWWRPAMVGFFGWGSGFGGGFGFGNIGWIPLFPHERFQPWYGRGGFGGRSVNINIVHNTNIYNNFRNAGVAGGVSAVTAGDFGRGNFRNNVAVDRNTLQQASLVHGAVPVTPGTQHLRFNDRPGSAPASRASAPTATANGRFFSSSAPSTAAQRTPFTQQQASVRSAFGVQGGAARTFSQPQSQAQSAGPQNRMSAGGAPGWQRFEGSSNTPRGAGPAQSQAQAQNQNASPAWNRFEGRTNGSGPVNNTSPAERQPMRQQQGPIGNPGGQQMQQPRQYQQVAPPIVRERQAQTPAPRSFGPPAQNYAPQNYAQPRQAPPGQNYAPQNYAQPRQASPAQNYAPQNYAQPRQAPAAPQGGGGYRGAPPAQRSAPSSGGRESQGGRTNGRR